MAIEWRSLEQHVLWRGPTSCTRGGLASAPVRMGGAGASGAYSLASSIVSLVFFIVSFVFVSIIVIMSLRGQQRRWWMACTTCGRRMCLASSEGGKRIAERIRARCASGEPADGQPVASDSSTAAKLFDVSACCRVRACASRTRLARVVRACRACSARVCSCAGRSAASAGVAVARRIPVRHILLLNSGNREIENSGNRESASRAYDFIREASCSWTPLLLTVSFAE